MDAEALPWWVGPALGVVVSLLLICWVELHRIGDALWFICNYGIREPRPHQSAARPSPGRTEA